MISFNVFKSANRVGHWYGPGAQLVGGLRARKPGALSSAWSKNFYFGAGHTQTVLAFDSKLLTPAGAVGLKGQYNTYTSVYAAIRLHEMAWICCNALESKSFWHSSDYCCLILNSFLRHRGGRWAVLDGKHWQQKKSMENGTCRTELNTHIPSTKMLGQMENEERESNIKPLKSLYSLVRHLSRCAWDSCPGDGIC